MNLISFYFKKYFWTYFVKYSKIILITASLIIFLIFLFMVAYGLIDFPIKMIND